MICMNKIVKEWLNSLKEAFIIVLILFIFFWPIKIHGRSMEKTFFSNDRVIVSRALVFFNKISQSDIVVCRINESGNTLSIIKRIIAVSGDSIQIQNGKVFVNDKLIEEPYVYYTDGTDMDKMVVPENEYFVMGDNRQLSYDSRYTYIGTIPKNKIIGKVILKWFPINKFKIY